MPSFTLSSDDDALQNSSTQAVAVQCETSAADVAAAVCRRKPSNSERRGASANAEKVDDNFQFSKSITEGLMRNAQDGRMLMMENIIGMKSSNSWDDVPVDMILNGQSGSLSIALAHKLEVDPLRERTERSYNNLPTWCLQEELCVKEADPEDEEEACVTPRAKEHCIPLEILVCPPPPCKKRRTFDLSLSNGIKVRKRLSYAMPPSSASSSSASSPQYMNLQGQLYAAACQVVVSPPDLHTFPACMRALFFHD